MIAKESKAGDDNIEVLEARPSDVASCETILARSFHPGNEFIKSALPDTPAMRAWWHTVFVEEIESPFAHPVIAVDESTHEVVGFACLRHVQPSNPDHEPLGGFWNKHSWTPDHDEKRFRGIVDTLSHWEEVMFGHGKDYLHIEMMGVDARYRGRGVGKKLLDKVCQIADEKHCAIFLQSGGAKDYFAKKVDFGFITLEKEEWGGYQAFLSVRPAVSAN